MPVFDYTDPVGRPPPDAEAPADPGVGYAEDIGKGAVGGLGRGVTGMIGGTGSLGDLTRAGLTKMGVPEGAINFGAGVARSALPFGIGLAAAGPSSTDVQHAVENYTGKFYEPQTIPGQYASTAAEFAPAVFMPGGGGILARVVNTLTGAIGSETAGQLTKGLPAEPYARFLGGLVTPTIAAKAITPAAPISATRQRFNDTLTSEGVPVMAGQLTGSKPVQWAESVAADMPFSGGRAAQMNAAQADAYNQAVTAKNYDPAQLRARGVDEGVNLPDPTVVVAGKQSLKDEYTRLSQNIFQSDPQLFRDLQTTGVTYNNNVLPSQRASGSRDISDIHNDILNKLIAGEGAMPGSEYQAIRSRAGKQADTAYKTDPYLGEALASTQKALDEAMQRGLSPADAAAWKLNNVRYARMKDLAGAVAGAGENLSPARVAQALSVSNPERYAAQTSDLDRLAKAAKEILKPLPQSGTAPRLMYQTLFNIPAMIAGGYAGSGYGLMGSILGTAAPLVASRAALSGPGQAYLRNRKLPQNPRDVITQALTQQGISQPSGIEQNQAAQAAYEQRRVEDLRKAGLQ